jgi:hypothetical protein
LNLIQHKNFYIENGQYTELGGEWIHGEVGNSIFELVSPLGLLQPTKSRPLEVNCNIIYKLYAKNQLVIMSRKFAFGLVWRHIWFSIWRMAELNDE